MEILHETKESHPRTFFNHVFSTTEDGKAEILNVVQYSTLGVVPVVILNKLINRFIPDADPDKSSIALLAEIFIQLVVMFCGIVMIHRIITYIPTYSGFKYDNLALTNVILAFLIIVLSIQTKLGLKVNILIDRLDELWNGSDSAKQNIKGEVRVKQANVTRHAPSQADYLDNGPQTGIFPPAPVATSHAHGDNYDFMMRSGNGAPSHVNDYSQPMGPVAANGLLGGAFGDMF
jgi:hypothetical protein